MLFNYKGRVGFKEDPMGYEAVVDSIMRETGMAELQEMEAKVNEEVTRRMSTTDGFTSNWTCKKAVCIYAIAAAVISGVTASVVVFFISSMLDTPAAGAGVAAAGTVVVVTVAVGATAVGAVVAGAVDAVLGVVVHTHLQDITAAELRKIDIFLRNRIAYVYGIHRGSAEIARFFTTQIIMMYGLIDRLSDKADDIDSLQILFEEIGNFLECPISLGIPEDPIFASDHRVYSRGALQIWYDGETRQGRVPLAPAGCVPLADPREEIIGRSSDNDNLLRLCRGYYELKNRIAAAPIVMMRRWR